MKNEIVKKLKEKVSINNTLVELIDIFREVCEPNFVEYDDIYLFETGVYNFSGDDLFYFSLVLQYQNPGDDEYMQIHFNITYLLIKELQLMENNIVWSEDVDDFWSTIKTSNAFEYIISRNLKINNIEIYEEET